MNILILGGGRVGEEIARALVENRCTVTVVDTNANRLLELQKTIDLLGVEGSASSPSVLVAAGVEDADIVIAVTAVDEINIVACRLCAMLFNTPTKIAKVSSSVFFDKDKYQHFKDGFAVDYMFCPEQIVADNICSIILHSGVLESHAINNSQGVLASIAVSAKSSISGEAIKDIRKHLPEHDFRIMSLYRDGRPIKPTPDTRFFVGDEVSLVTASKSLDYLTAKFSGDKEASRSIMIAGGGNVGKLVASQIEQKCSVKMIEIGHERCQYLSKTLENTLVLKGSATDESLLKQEGIDATDMFCSLTNHDNENILAAMLAKELGAQKTVVISKHDTYSNILGKLLDIVISPSLLTIGSVLAHIRLGDISSVYPLHKGSVEVIEANIHGDATTSPVVGRKMNDINWTAETVPGAIIRNGQLLLAHHGAVIEKGDRLIALAIGKKGLHSMEKLLQVNFLYH